jgi:hypothetical protein
MSVIAPSAIISVPTIERTTSGVMRLVNPVERDRREPRVVRGFRVAVERVVDRPVPRVAIG